MKSIVRRGRSLSFSQKLTRLSQRLHQPKWQKYGATMLAGKLAGVGLTLLIMAGITTVFFAKVCAADAPMKAADIVNPAAFRSLRKRANQKPARFFRGV